MNPAKEVFATDSVGVANVMLTVNGRTLLLDSKGENVLASGIAENFQLNVLLMDVFPRAGLFSKRRADCW